MKTILKLALGATLGAASVCSAIAGELTIATVNNGHMIEMQKLTPEFEKAHPVICISSKMTVV